MKAVVTIDHCAAAPGLGGPPAEKSEVLLGPIEKYISAHWSKAYKLPRKNVRVFNQMTSDQWKTGHRVDVARGHLLDAPFTMSVLAALVLESQFWRPSSREDPALPVGILQDSSVFLTSTGHLRIRPGS
eukprot:8001558-Pyramimonas_sp.AAC.1